MRNLLAAASVAMVMSLASIAMAEELTGTVAGIDDSRILLNDGSLFILGEGVSAEGLTVGSLVIVVFEQMANGQMVATEIKPVQ